MKLKDLLSEAVSRAALEMRKRKLARISTSENALLLESVNLTEEEERVARIIGVSSVKYCDLSFNRNTDYQFSYDKILALNGNTYCYMLYVYVRIEGIRRKIAESGDKSTFSPIAEIADDPHSSKIMLASAEELSLARHLIRFDEVLVEISSEFLPHKVSFYQNMLILHLHISFVYFSLVCFSFVTICTNCRPDSIHFTRTAQS